MIISWMELLRLVIMTAGIGYIFSETFTYDPLKPRKYFDWPSMKLGIYAAAPAVILHEMAHKFVALAYGLNAEFFASYFGLGLGILLKAIGSPFLIFVPGYVSISGATPLQSAITAVVGPLTNGLLWLIAWGILKTQKKLGHKTRLILTLTKRINGILFIFNLIPIPPFDGGHVLQGLIQYFSA